jgi:diguanylate cyclase (GGDEF)-like protein/PAS domain S-box-containing protein
VVATDMHGVITHWSSDAHALFGWSAEEAVGAPVDELILIPGARLPAFAERLKGSVPWAGPALCRSGTGRILPVLATVSLLEGSGGSPAGMVGVFQPLRGPRHRQGAPSRDGADVDAPSQAAVQGRAGSGELSQETLAAVADAFILLDPQGRVLEWNASAAEMFGVARADAVGMLLAEVTRRHRVAPEILDGLAQQLAGEAAGDPVAAHFEATALRPGGRPLPVEVSTVTFDRENGRYVAAFVRDVTQRRAMERQLALGALTDLLTGLPNRALIGDRLRLALERAERDGTGVAVVLVDIDCFGVINVGLGEEAGDELLMIVAERLFAAASLGDTVGRWGADEFGVIAEGLASAGQALELARRLQEAVSIPATVGGEQIVPSASIGVAYAPGRPTSRPEPLMPRAAIALQRAKTRRGGCELFRSEVGGDAAVRLRTESELHGAVEGGQVRLYYQPVVSMRGRVVGLEALARWQHPDRGLLPPLEFIGLAEETGVIVPLGAWVLRTACEQAEVWRAAGLDPGRVAVNVSAHQLVSPGFVDLVRELVAGYRSAKRLSLEITESALIEDPAAATVALSALHDLGVHLVIDDFGTGYASLLYVRRFPVQALKLDRTFVMGLGENEEDEAIVAAVVQLAHSLNMDTVAEGVETASQQSILTDLGCDYAQGNLWSPPLPPDAVRRLLASGRPLRAVPSSVVPNRHVLDL